MATLLDMRLAAAKAHPSHPSFIIGQFEPFGSEHPFLNEYISTCIVTLIVAIPFYFTICSLAHMIYYHWFKQTFAPQHQQRRYSPETFWYDIKWSTLNILGQTPLISLVKMGYPYFSKIQYEWTFTAMTPLFLLFHICFDQFLTYWGHRLLHHPRIYKKIHIIHHNTKAVTPFTGFAFHPLDAFIQALPVFTSCYFVPININLVLAHGLATSLWAVSIHDNVNMIPFKGILYAGSHSIHHYPWGVNYNYGKFTSVCDRLYGTYCDPEGITGFGYKPSKWWQTLMDKMNTWYANNIPDKGIKVVSQIRKLYSNKIK